jgi:hypothetical protein
LARPCTFDPFLRLAMIDPPGLVGVRYKLPRLGNLSNEFSKRERVPYLPCDDDHSAPDSLLLRCDCTVRPRRCTSNGDLGPLNGGPLSL